MVATCWEHVAPCYMHNCECVCVCVCVSLDSYNLKQDDTYHHIIIYIHRVDVHKHPSGWETALAVKHSSGAVATYTFVHQHCPKFCRAKSSDFEEMTPYLQRFVHLGWWSLFTSAFGVSLLQAFAQSAAGETEEVFAISIVPSLLPTFNSLRVHCATLAFAPRT